MKKTSYALAILAAVASFAGAAHAQEASSGSSVTIYGLLETSISNVSNGGSLLTNTSATGANGLAKPGTTSVNGLGSRIGFKGSEDLGGGLKAKFQLEQRFTTDTGANTVAGSSFAGRSVVGFDSPYGEVLLGRNYTPAFYVAVFADPFAFDSSVAGMGAGNTMAGYAGRSVGSATRMDNSVAYTSPVFAGGLTLSASVSAGENAAAGANNSGRGLNAIYAMDAMKLGLAYDRRNDGANLTIAAGSYDLGYIKPIVSYSRAVSALNVSTRDYSIGATAPLGAGVAKTVYARLNSAGISSSKFGLGYEYSFSKRTSVFADVATGSTTGLSRTNAVDMGVRHAF